MRRLFPIISLTLLLTACNFSFGTPVEDNTPPTDSGALVSSSSSADEEPPVGLPTHNVSYVGTVAEAKVVAEATFSHTLTLSDGSTIDLVSTDAGLNLQTYVGKKVEVRGTVQAMAEAGGTLMHVEEVTILEPEARKPGQKGEFCGGIAGFACAEGFTCVDDASDDCDPAHGGADCGGVCVTQMTSSSQTASSEPSTSSSASSSSKKSSSSSSSRAMSSSSSSAAMTSSSVDSSAPSMTNAAIEAQVVAMSKQNYTQASLWTQQYCTGHIGFCVPAHKNWYFTSFGAKASTLWHVEFGMTAIAQVGDGPLVLNLTSGSVASMGAQDGQIRVQGSDVIGFKDWKNGTHFEVIADARLKEAVSYMLSHLTDYNPAP